MFLTIASYVPVVICLYAIGLLTFFKNTTSQINRFFGLFAALLASWLAMLFVGDFALDPSISLWAVRVAAMLGTMTLPFFLFFCLKFPLSYNKLGNRFWLLASLPAVIFGLLCFTPWLIPAIDLSDGSAQPAKLGLLYTLQSVYLICGYIFAIVILFLKRQKVIARQKNQITLVIIGMATALVVNILTGFVLTIANVSNNYSNLLGSISFLIFVGFTAYAIVKHRMFDIRLAIVRTIGFVITVGFIGGIYSLLILGIGLPFISDSSLKFARDDLGLLFLILPTIFIGLTFHSIQKYIARVTRRIFYQDLYDLRSVMDSFSDTLVTSNDIGTIMDHSLAVISEAIKPTHCYFVVFDDHGRVYRKILSHTKAPRSISELVGDIKSMGSNPVVRDELPEADIPRSFIEDDIFLALRLGAKDKPVAVLLFGPKQNGRIFTKQDIDLLRIGAKNLAIALENAKKYEQIGHFADTMHKEVLSATAELRKVNQELKSLDVMKDDFISMASHQLRTPASSVHEALQMLNHPSMKLTLEERNRLVELAEASSEHLVTVVADMLSISRIQAGHFTVNKTPFVMQDLVERVIKQTSVLADQKKIKLVFDKPKESISIEADQAKINEAISNYIENAVKYSGEKTTISINLAVAKDRIIFETIDQGMGVPEKERKNLFGKFFRAGNARNEQPDGNGIGLFVVKSIATAHGGNAYYKPQDTGSLFGFWLPS